MPLLQNVHLPPLRSDGAGRADKRIVLGKGAAVKYCLLALVCMLATPCVAKTGEWSLGLDEVDVTYQKIVNNRDPLQPDIPSSDWADHVAIAPQLRLLKKGFFNSEWYFNTAYHKVSEVGLHFDLGVHVFDWADVLYTHWSYHSADKTNAYQDMDAASRGYGLNDFVGIRLKFKP